MHPIHLNSYTLFTDTPPCSHLIAPMSVSTLAYISKYPKSVTQLHNSIDNGLLSIAYESQIID